MPESVRMRLREEQTHLLYHLLMQERGDILEARNRWRRFIPTTPFNRHVALIDSTLQELDRAAVDGGWILGEPGEPNP